MATRAKSASFVGASQFVEGVARVYSASRFVEGVARVYSVSRFVEGVARAYSVSRFVEGVELVVGASRFVEGVARVYSAIILNTSSLSSSCSFCCDLIPFVLQSNSLIADIAPRHCVRL